ncbi:MAG TPA: glycerophosphodiester phosphodiesterase family protein [Candidatus Brocadiia bacterium]|nr:glycerophosphodiester phosphodiesterase family protein [Candidatus Brocadiia bacterium]
MIRHSIHFAQSLACASVFCLALSACASVRSTVSDNPSAAAKPDEPDTPRIEIVAHRGANELAPENTFASAELCVEMGVDYVEVDVRTSRDGVFYVLHDEMVNRTTNGSGPICMLNSAQVDKLDAGSWFNPRFSDQRIPRLDAFLRWIKGRAKVYFDVKTCDVNELAALIRETGFDKDGFIWAASPITQKAFQIAAPDLALKVNVSTPEDVREAKRVFDARIVEFETGCITPEMMSTCRDVGVKTMACQSAKDPAAYRKVIETGTDYIILDHPDAFIEVRERMRAEKRAGKEG